MLATADKEDNPEALGRLRDRWAGTGRPRDDNAIGVYYPRGVLAAALFGEAIRLTGEDVKRGLESLAEFPDHGLGPGTTIAGEDHAGSCKVRLYQVRNGRPALEHHWFEGSRLA